MPNPVEKQYTGGLGGEHVLLFAARIPGQDREFLFWATPKWHPLLGKLFPTIQTRPISVEEERSKCRLLLLPNGTSANRGEVSTVFDLTIWDGMQIAGWFDISAVNAFHMALTAPQRFEAQKRRFHARKERDKAKAAAGIAA